VPASPPTAARTVDAYELRDATDDDFDSVNQLLKATFLSPDEPGREEIRRLVFEAPRNHVIVDDGQVVANAGAYTRDLAVPGGVVPAAHVTLVAVASTHRRQGLLTRLMRRQLDAVPEAVAVLWASEGRIYQRYGYGLAAKSASLHAETHSVALSAAAGAAEHRLRAAMPAEVRKDLQEVYLRTLADLPGRSSRDERWWDVLLADPTWAREGFTAKRAVLYEDASGLNGYAIWRAKGAWDAGGPAGEVQVLEVTAATPHAYATLWRFLFSVDLTRTLHAPLVSVDEPLFYLVDEPRRLGARVGDGLWVRLVDLPAALRARRYAAPLDIVLEVTDALRPANAGRWRLRTGPDGAAVCIPAPGDQPALACDIADLGAAYLGGTLIGQLADAGRVHELRPGGVAAASAAFGWHRPPASIEIF
jgi:predicted acetyltransferase